MVHELGMVRMAHLGLDEMQAIQKQLQEKYKDLWGGLSPRKGRDQLLWMMIEAGEAADIIKKQGDTPILEDVRVADFRMTYPHSGEVIVHHAEGNHITKNDFAPHSTPLVAGETFAMMPEGGRSSQGQFLPFFNIQTPGGQGVVVAIGWTGTWFADIDKVGDRGMPCTRMR